VPRHGGAADRERVGELAHGAIAGAEQLDDRPPVGVAERVEGVAGQRHARRSVDAEDPAGLVGVPGLARVGGWYGLRKGYRGRFGMYVPPVLEALGLAEVEHNARNNRMRASDQ
jgi:hypothetical protein